MTLDKCIQCQHHISFFSGYVVCNYWKHNQQHVVNHSEEGSINIVGCSIDDTKKR